MGVAAIGGLITSTLLTLVVVPAAYSYMERFRLWSLAKVKKTFAPADPNARMEVKHEVTDNHVSPEIKNHDHLI
jgi:hypothetical protein